MPKYNINLITTRRSYLIKDITDLYGVSGKTCHRWISEGGLATIEGIKPYFIRGEDLIDFINKQREKGKIPIRENEFLCLKCHKAVKAKAGSEQIIETGKTIGKDNHKQLRKTGICEVCERKVFKYLRVCQRD